ncbi:MAG: hypothetical protein ACIAXF_00215 [Phycisphaerales bacterium JB063]
MKSVLWLVLCWGGVVGCVGCTTVFETQDPTHQTLPRVVGESLAGASLTLPDDLRGRPTVLLVIYETEAQDDVNYWAMVAMANLPEAQLYEVAAFTKLKHLLTRRHIIRRAAHRVPEALHDRLIGVWWHGRTLARFTGNPRDGHARVLLLDEQGRVVFFTDAGFNSQTLRAFLEAIDAYRQRGGW